MESIRFTLDIPDDIVRKLRKNKSKKTLAK